MSFSMSSTAHIYMTLCKQNLKGIIFTFILVGDKHHFQGNILSIYFALIFLSINTARMSSYGKYLSTRLLLHLTEAIKVK